MRSLNGIGLALSLTFGCLMLALMAEIYYLLWWKRRSLYRESSTGYCSSSSAREFLYMFCCKKPANTQPLSSTTVSFTDMSQLPSTTNNMDFLVKSDGVGSDGFMGFHDLTCPPRILCTILEETVEDLESEDGKVSVRSFSDLVAHRVETETPYLTPLSSPSMFTPPHNPMLDSAYTRLGFNPLFESSSDAEFSRMKASPSPKLKFLREAEDKFQTRMLMEAAKAEEDHYSYRNGCAQYDGNKRVDKDESFITIIVAKGSRSHRG